MIDNDILKNYYVVIKKNIELITWKFKNQYLKRNLVFE